MPMYWRDEMSGRLLASVMAFWSPYAEHPQNVSELETKDIENLKMYLVHWAKAPCWRLNPNADAEKLAELDKAIALTQAIDSRKSINRALSALMELGIDPF